MYKFSRPSCLVTHCLIVFGADAIMFVYFCVCWILQVYSSLYKEIIDNNIAQCEYIYIYDNVVISYFAVTVARAGGV